MEHDQEAVTGELVVLEGSHRGKRFALQERETMVGSNPTCQICLKGKDIPARAALIERHSEGEYRLAALAAEVVSVNGEPVSPQTDRILERGDEIAIGGNRLRYVAPGEVFTLQKEAADRVVDREPTAGEKVFKLVVIGLIGICAIGGVWYYMSVSAQKERVQQHLREKQQQRAKLINQYTKKGDKYFREGALDTPPGANAKEFFAKILELAPDDSYAKGRLREINLRLKGRDVHLREMKLAGLKVSDLLKEGASFMQLGQYVYPEGRNAREVYNKVLELDPGNKVATKRLKEIAEKIAALSKQVVADLKKAQEYIDKHQFVAPQGKNAYDLLEKVLQVDPQNAAAKKAILDMAAYAIHRGNEMRAKADGKKMLRWYKTAEALGVDPDYLRPLERGASLMEQSSKSAVVIYDVQGGEHDDEAAKDKSGYLPLDELKKRVAKLEVDHNATQKGKRQRLFIDMSDPVSFD